MRLVVLFACAVFLGSCNAFDEEEDIPAYIKIDHIDLEHEDPALGISDAWVYVNNNLLGVFELPAEVPVLETGKQLVTIRPGIKVNALGGTRTYYPFYTSFIDSVELIPENVHEINPKVKYWDWAWEQIIWEENFEGIGHDLSGYTEDDIVNDTTGLTPFGNKCAYIPITSESYKVSTPEISIMKKKTDEGGYFELNYKSTNDFGVYILAGGAYPLELIWLKSSDTWKKVYFDIYTPTSNYLSEGYYNVYFKPVYDETKADQEQYIMLDNLRIIGKNE